MRYWKHILSKGLSYDKAKRYAEMYRPYYITREEWDGVHFYNEDGKYCILLKTGEVLINPRKIQDTDKEDWIVVVITEDAIKAIEEYTKIV